MTTWRNKRPHGAYALTASNAFHWHADCPCQDPKPAAWRQVSGKGREGSWASEWLDWLWRTHLEPRGFKCIGKSGRRGLDLVVAVGDVGALRSAIASGPLIDGAAPTPPFDPLDSRRGH